MALVKERPSRLDIDVVVVVAGEIVREIWKAYEEEAVEALPCVSGSNCLVAVCVQMQSLD